MPFASIQNLSSITQALKHKTHLKQLTIEIMKYVSVPLLLEEADSIDMIHH